MKARPAGRGGADARFFLPSAAGGFARGEEIPLEARIMAIADVYDALVSARPYKDRFSFEEADRIIREGMGTQFDPALRKYYEAARPKLEAFYAADREAES